MTSPLPANASNIFRVFGENLFVVRQRLVVFVEFEVKIRAPHVKVGLVRLQGDQMRQVAESLLLVLFVV